MFKKYRWLPIKKVKNGKTCYVYLCPKCSKRTAIKTKYCPHCGKKLGE